MNKTTVYLDDALAARLRQIAAVRRRPQAELIREALSEYAAREAAQLPAGAGSYSSGRKDLSERAEELLREAARKRRLG